MSDDQTIDPNQASQQYDAAMIDRARQLIEQMPTHIGPYRILEKLGGGGMGEVYVAEQTAPIKRRVALKVIKAGMDTRQVVARFEAERQALAMMDHPNIARVFDAGATDTGRPYFVMELVRGVPITRFADDNKLTTRQRVELLVPICQAVQHAHQKGIIHRDIKPHNVLVTLHDGVPVPKVIDFGIAKATTQPLTDKTVYTELRAMIGTPAYMSPEQAEMSGLDIDTRSDIYSLGVLAYELLTGSPPFDSERLVKAGIGEIQRIIREEEPPRPSIRLSTIGDRLTTIAKSRDVDPSKLSKLLAGELDWIVMRAMEKDRKRRYDTATDLAADLKRHLDGEPVVAAPPTWAYRTRKFVRKNKGLLAAAAAIGAVMALGLGGTSWEAIRALQERKKTDFVNSQLLRERNRAASTLKRINTATYGEDAMDLDPIAKMVQKATGREVSSVDLLAADAEAINGQLQQRTEAAELEAYTADLALAQSAMASGNWPEARSRLDACPESKCGWEWTFLRRAAASVVCSFPKLADPTFIPQSESVLARESNGKIAYVWDSLGNRVSDPLNYSGGEIQLSPKGARILIRQNGSTLRLMDAGGKPVGEPIVISPNPEEEAWRFSSDGSTIIDVHRDGPTVVMLKNTVRMWTSECVAKGGAIQIEEGQIADFNRDASLILGVTAEGFTIWDRTGHRKFPPIPLEGIFTSLLFSPNGTLVLTINKTGVARLWDLSGHQVGDAMRISNPAPEPETWGNDKYNVTAAFSADGRLVLTCDGTHARLWDLGGKLLHEFSGAAGAVFSSDGSKILVRNRENTSANLFYVDGRVATEPIISSAGYDETDPLNFIRVLGDGNLLGLPEDTLTVRELSGRTILSGSFPVSYADFKNIYGLSDDGHLAILNTKDDLPCPFHLVDLRQFDGPIDKVPLNSPEYLCVFASGAVLDPSSEQSSTKSGDFRWAIDGSGTAIEVTRDGRPPVSLHSNSGRFRSATLSPDKKRFVTGGEDHTVRFWNTQDWRQLIAIGVKDVVSKLRFTPDGTRLVLWEEGGTTQVWDTRTPQERQTERSAQRAWHNAAEEYIGKLLPTASSRAKLLLTIDDDTNLSPPHRAAVMESLHTRLAQMRRDAESEFMRFNVLRAENLLSESETRSIVHSDPTLARNPLMVEEIDRRFNEISFVFHYRTFDYQNIANQVLLEESPPARSEYERAKTILEKAIVDYPEDEPITNMLGITQYRLGQYDQAIKTLRRAVKIKQAAGGVPDFDEVGFIAMAQFKLGDVAEAKTSLKEAMSMPFDNKDWRAEAVALIDPASTQPKSRPSTSPQSTK